MQARICGSRWHRHQCRRDEDQISGRIAAALDGDAGAEVIELRNHVDKAVQA
jgi:hypothetical protein